MPIDSIHRIDVSVIAAEVDDAVLVDGRRDDTVASGKAPLDAMELSRAFSAIDARLRGVAAKHRLPMYGPGSQHHRGEAKHRSLHDFPPDARRRVSGSSIDPSSI